ncbi:hypothetical protein NLJ89_g6667 [Agrocybe chaxingu]|uniref:HMG domain-containing protein n=1 Tax=Agrocybe chaxingu TaxID=84603 RepID=A0A9W8MSG8_9AGAR|nr:hypothetical protein NLJ89_g6667 [Agrocybe chaxingu]
MEDTTDGVFINLFSIPARNQHALLKNRAVVEHCGRDTGEGQWKCSIDRSSSSCAHIRLARHSLQQHLTGLPSARDPNVSSSEDLPEFEVLTIKEGGRLCDPVSYKRLPPPVWARIPADPVAPPIPILETPPDLITLEIDSQCSCPARTRFKAGEPTEVKQCTLYTLTGASRTSIQLQRCGECARGFVGPDGSDIGVFNFNNVTLLTLDLLEDYTCAFTTSETPFVSWVAVVGRRYETRRSAIPFLKEKTFRAAWFAYIQLISLDNDMECTRCGPCPDVTIWDGVTLAFNRKHLLQTLSPPTKVHADSEIKPLVKLGDNLQFIPSSKLRKDLQDFLSHKIDLPPRHSPSDSTTTNGGISEPDSSSTVPSSATISRLASLPGITASLSEIDPHLGALFDKHFGTEATLNQYKAPQEYCDLFLHISAHEYALQMINGQGLEVLREFVLDPSPMNASKAIRIPALHRVLSFEWKSKKSFNSHTLGTCRWLYIRSYTTLNSLKKYNSPLSPSVPLVEENWKEIRRRPIYPGISKDGGNDQGGQDMRGEGCQKFYSRICYGFHCIPSAEGRNDVFSAIYTRWKKPPTVIVYDFACALQPYCMAREPDFFSKTLFAIDVFHATGHTRCGRSAFLSTYAETDPDLALVNTSAAECGNSGILRIRKSIDVSKLYVRRDAKREPGYDKHNMKSRVLKAMHSRQVQGGMQKAHGTIKDGVIVAIMRAVAGSSMKGEKALHFTGRVFRAAGRGEYLGGVHAFPPRCG